MNMSLDKKSSIRHKVREELISYSLISAYLFACFSALLLYSSAVSGAGTIHLLTWGIALGKALILAKFILIGEGLGVGTRVTARTVLHRIAVKVLLFLLLLVVLSVIEELVVGWVHGLSAAQSWVEAANRGWLRILASALIMLLILIPLITFKEIGRELGEGGLWGLLTSKSKNGDRSLS